MSRVREGPEDYDCASLWLCVRITDCVSSSLWLCVFITITACPHHWLRVLITDCVSSSLWLCPRITMTVCLHHYDCVSVCPHHYDCVSSSLWLCVLITDCVSSSLWLCVLITAIVTRCNITCPTQGLDCVSLLQLPNIQSARSRSTQHTVWTVCLSHSYPLLSAFYLVHNTRFGLCVFVIAIITQCTSLDHVHNARFGLCVFIIATHYSVY